MASNTRLLHIQPDKFADNGLTLYRDSRQHPANHESTCLISRCFCRRCCSDKIIVRNRSQMSEILTTTNRIPLESSDHHGASVPMVSREQEEDLDDSVHLVEDSLPNARDANEDSPRTAGLLLSPHQSPVDFLQEPSYQVWGTIPSSGVGGLEIQASNPRAAYNTSWYITRARPPL